MKIKLLEPMMGREGDKISLIANGKQVSRRVYFRKDCGLYVVIDSKMFFEYELWVGEEVTIDI